ncbi:MAG: amidophosphoribosyltransferase [Clostridia bacterium]|nr:amidophosphoribosyltransferase [Clostridia bacterium]MDE6355899.1 amidophosphoribosyltransferase [Clostridia bacterium]
MGGFFGSVKKSSAVFDVFLGTDYHSHLGTKRGGMAAYDKETGLQREIHNIENAPFRTKFERVLSEMHGNAAIGCISDTDPQPLLTVSRLGTYAICTIGIINNADALMREVISQGGGYFDAMTGGRVNSNELIAALINSKESYVEGIRYAQDKIDGTASILLLTDKGTLIAARDKVGRLPVLVGKCDDGYCVSFESFAYKKLGYADERELGPAEIVEISADGITQLAPAGKKMRICAFLWSYYGYPTSTYEGINVEMMRCKNGEIFARNDAKTHDLHQIDYVGGVPDSGTPHAIGYANAGKIPFARPYIKYTPTWARSFMPVNQTERNKIAKMKLIPVHEFIEGKRLLLVDDSIVRGTQLKETVEFLYSHGAKAVHMRSACPPIMYGCKYLNFSRSSGDMDLITRRTMMELEGEKAVEHMEEYSNADTARGKAMRKAICDKFHFESLEFQSIEGLIEAIGLEPCKLCTYCWTGKE